MLNILVTGAAGKMGKMVINAVREDPSCRLAAATEYSGNPFVGHDAGTVAGVGPMDIQIEDNILSSIDKCDCVIDFTSPSAFPAHLKAAVDANKAVVFGTTGLGDKEKALLADAGKNIPVIWAPNFSVGVTLIAKLTRLAAEVLKEGFDVEIVETHHRMKKDSPSGTALKLLNSVKEVRKNDKVVYGREGIVGERPADQIGVFAIRGGDVVGDHTVGFYGTGERVEITHKATSRETFARGALRAAKFIVSAGKGVYSMEDVLGFK
jgi:4-hydroxy-tetrahydrodipicolinate reductase